MSCIALRKRASSRRVSRRFRELLLVSLSAACGASSSAPVREPSIARAEPTSTTNGHRPEHPARTEAGTAGKLRNEPDAFIVQSDTGKLELRSTNGTPSRELAPHASESIYDPALELIWFVDEDSLKVIDIRATDLTPVEIARGVPEVSVLDIQRANSSVGTDPSCQGPSFRLLWQNTPSFEAYDSDTEDTQIVGSSWLQKHFDRAVRGIGATRKFADAPRVRLPRKLLDCEELSECATTAKFGTEGLELVLVRDKGGGDCWNRACIVHDPNTNRYASPSDLQTWTAAAKAKPGTCGPFYFDQSQKSYLVGNRLCTLGAPCQKLHGQALGWLQSGDIVGDVGGADLQETDDDDE